ncbi:MAG: peptidase C45 [Ignavibacteria bacterium]|nr:peptidase C45 [Ignavibacteria bacterium]
MKRLPFALLLLTAALSLFACDSKLKESYRQERNGWIYVHLEGTPRQVGFQHGYHLASEIDEVLQMFAFYFEKGSAQKPWTFFREAAERVFWPKLEQEYQQEIEGIVEGLVTQGYKYDKFDITALNANIEIASYYLPWLANKVKQDSMKNQAPGRCSAFIATGSYTDDGKIVIAHNNWSDYMVGQRWNVIVDISPVSGHRILMDCMPGFIHSGDDFAINDAGLLYTETTITQFHGFDESGTPEFMRARKAAQYGSSIDDFIEIMTTNNNGAYANDWLVGDTKTNEIARLELGLKNHRVWRTFDGMYEGSNFPIDEKLIKEETTFNPNDRTVSANSRKIRWAQLMKENKGKINIELAKQFEGDHFNTELNKIVIDGSVLCGHVDRDPRGAPEWSSPPFFPTGAVQAKATTAALAKEMKLWARMGHPCGEDFMALPFFEKHPEFKWQEKFLKDMKGQPWTLFEAKR